MDYVKGNPNFPANLIENDQQRLAQALVETARVINQSLNLDEVLQLILKTIGVVVPHDAANIMLLDGGFAVVTAVHGYEKLGVDTSVLLGHRRDISLVPTFQQMAVSGTPVVIPDTNQSTEWVNFSTSGWIRSYLSTPIQHKQKTIGFINLNSATPGFYSKLHAERLKSFADQAAIAIENARLYEKAQEELAFRKKMEIDLQNAMSDLEYRVEQRTVQLKNINEQLQMELKRRQKAEHSLELERASLARRVEERTAELSAANAELAKAAQLKDAFLANMSHELRTPLNAILNISETMEEQVYGPLADRQIKAVRTQRESATHLLALINDILDLSKIGAGKFELFMDLVPVQTLCDASLKLVEEVANKKGITLSLRIDPQVKSVWGDMRRLKQVLVNLLSNAVKFTPQQGQVGLIVQATLENRQIHFIVWDTGIGIEEANIPKLFKPFTQLDNSLARKYEGTGLGLALAYHIIEMHGGGIAVNSEAGRGSQFIVTLNWNDGKEEAAGRAQQFATEIGDIETYSSVSNYIVQALTEFDIQVASYFIEPNIIEKIISVSPNLIVLNLPLDEQCRALVKDIRKHSITCSIPILISTRLADREKLANLPEGTIPLNFLSSRQEFRKILKTTSVNGTASLIRKAVLIKHKINTSARNETRIMLVDDNEVTVRPLYDYLITRGYHLVMATSGAEAIVQAREFKPDLILMDIQMPGMDGIEAIHRIRADAKTKDIPILAVTALAMPTDRQRCLDAGANGYLSKPVTLRNLVEVIEQQIRNPDSQHH